MLSEDYIMKLIEGYAQSPAGRAEIKKKYGIDYKDPNRNELEKYGLQMKQTLFEHTNPLIKSITLDDIIVGAPIKGARGEYSITISFKEGSLTRDSLSLDETDGSGRPRENRLENIVLLFAKGYHARKNGGYVYGWWIDQYGNHGNVRSRKDREGNDFLIQAVNDFNKNFGKGFARAELLGDYKECSENPS